MAEWLFSLRQSAVDENRFPALRLAHDIALAVAADHRSRLRSKPAREGNERVILRADQEICLVSRYCA